MAQTPEQLRKKADDLDFDARLAASLGNHELAKRLKKESDDLKAEADKLEGGK